MNHVSTFVQTAMSHLAHVGPRGWFVGFVVTLVLGAICMRGFGSRSSY
ncbi:MAG TPA: hypothetical protein VFI31_16070 [Pirellulales bacterium]|nr:hypothetical protein [Pirellulales bacterium]